MTSPQEHLGHGPQPQRCGKGLHHRDGHSCPSARFLQLCTGSWSCLESLAIANRRDPAEPSCQATGIAYAQQDECPWKGRTRRTCWIPAQFQSQTPDLIISAWCHLDPPWERNLGWEGRGKTGGRDLAIRMEKGMKTKPLLPNKELNKGQRSLGGLIKA